MQERKKKLKSKSKENKISQYEIVPKSLKLLKRKNDVYEYNDISVSPNL